jgi:hypothetical protein
MLSRRAFGSLMRAAACVGGAAASSASAPTLDLDAISLAAHEVAMRLAIAAAKACSGLGSVKRNILATMGAVGGYGIIGCPVPAVFVGVDSMNSSGAVANGIGQPVRRREDFRLLTGRGGFADDIRLSGLALIAAGFTKAHVVETEKGFCALATKQ